LGSINRRPVRHDGGAYLSRKRCYRRVITPQPPRGLRARLGADQVRDLGLCHVVNLDAIATGTADVATLWQWVGGVLTWSRVAEVLQAGAPEMRAQLEMADRVIERFRRTGRVGFTGADYQLAKDGVQVMDQLSEIVDRATAVDAAEWSEARLNALVACGSEQFVSSCSGPAGRSDQR
jgi:hypothetical protein